jgi:hypothetical protein
MAYDTAGDGRRIDELGILFAEEVWYIVEFYGVARMRLVGRGLN